MEARPYKLTGEERADIESALAEAERSASTFCPPYGSECYCTASAKRRLMRVLSASM
jgi:hypothetical protein